MDSITFDFNYYRFNGTGSRPTVVPTVEQANFIRSRHSVENEFVDLATDRVARWASEHRIRLTPREPYPSSKDGCYWLEFHFGRLTV